MTICYCNIKLHIVISCLRADVSYFLCFTGETKEIGDVYTQAKCSQSQQPLFIMGMIEGFFGVEIFDELWKQWMKDRVNLVR